MPRLVYKAFPSGKIPSSYCAEVGMKEGCAELPEYLDTRLPKRGLSLAQLASLRGLLHDCVDVFQSLDGAVGKTDVAKHRIDLLDERPIKQRLRRAAITLQEVIDREVQKMLDLDIIENSDSPWASPVVMVKKKDGSWRFCVDYRKLNDVTRKDSYPLPHIEDTFDALAGSHYFCALDLALGYWQVQMEEDYKAKTAFVTKNGLYQFKVMPFGLCNAPATFERLMELVLKGYLWGRCMVYIDDVVVYGRSFEETLTNLRLVFERIRGAGLKLKPSKCDFFRKEILYLGFLVSGTGVRPDPKKVESVRNWPRQCGVADIRSFLGFDSYHRRFIKGFAETARPLTVLTEKDVEFVWEEAQEQAFTSLGDALLSAPVLDHPRRDCEFVLDTDASKYALGGVLSQVVDGVEHVVAYASTALSRSQMNYCTTHRELLAVVTMTKRFRHYLLGQHFRLRTDHSSLRWLLNYSEADGLVARWPVKLQEYDMEIEHRAGKHHGNADGLSHCHKCKNPDCPGAYRPLDVMDCSSESEMNVPGPSVPLAQTASAVKPRWQSVHTCATTRRHKPSRPFVPRECWQDRRGSPPAPPVDKGTLSEEELNVGSPDPIRVNAAKPQLDERLDKLSFMGGYTKVQLAAMQRADAALLPVIKALEAGQKPDRQQRRTFFRGDAISCISLGIVATAGRSTL